LLLDDARAGDRPEVAAKYLSGVPLYNYIASLRASGRSTQGTRNGTRWFVQARPNAEMQMRDICASTTLGRRHCHYVAENMPAFLFQGSERELAAFLAAYRDIAEFVEPDLAVRVFDGDEDEPDPELQGEVQVDPEWNLDRIDQRHGGLTRSYSPGIPGADAGSGTHVYVLDTGVRTTHLDFAGRAVPTFDVTSGEMRVCDPSDVSCAADNHGHGTHCAGVVGGKEFGVAKKATLHACKVLNPSGWSTDIVKGMDWVISHGIRPAVISMSLGGGGRSRAYKTAVNAAYSQGVPAVVAAGNEADDACDYSPAYVPTAITVGATKEPRRGKDPVSWFSNYGSCVDIFAPGSDIRSCGHQGDSQSVVMSGTSMACPAVAGAAALLLTAQPDMSAEQVAHQLKARATPIVIPGEYSYVKPNSPGLLLYVGDTNGTEVYDDDLDAEELGGVGVVVLIMFACLYSCFKPCCTSSQTYARTLEPLLALD